MAKVSPAPAESCGSAEIQGGRGGERRGGLPYYAAYKAENAAERAAAPRGRR